MLDTADKINVALSSIISIIGTFGNVLVIIAFIKMRNLRTITNIFVLVLAVNDLVKASILLTIKSIYQMRHHEIKNPVNCQISGIFRTIITCHSSLLLVAIAIVRYFRTVKPTYYDKIYSMKKAFVYCGCLFFISLLIGLLPICNIGKYTFSSTHGHCFVDWNKNNLSFRIIYYVITVGVTYTVLIFCYFEIFRKIRIHSQTVVNRLHCYNGFQRPIVDKPIAEEILADRSQDKGESADPEVNEVQAIKADADVADELESNNQNSIVMQKMAVKSHRKEHHRSDVEIEITRVLFAVFIAYTICWMPGFSVNILILSDTVHVPKNALIFIVTFVDLNVALNPLIYGIGSRQFRTSFLTLLRHYQS